MRWSDILLRFRALFRHREMDEDLADELQFHLEMQARKNQRYDVTSTEAQRQARLQFGSIKTCNRRMPRSARYTFSRNSPPRSAIRLAHTTQASGIRRRRSCHPGEGLHKRVYKGSKLG